MRPIDADELLRLYPECRGLKEKVAKMPTLDVLPRDKLIGAIEKQAYCEFCYSGPRDSCPACPDDGSSEDAITEMIKKVVF